MPRILVIDDSALMREVLGRHLEKAGFDVEAWMPDSVFEVSERLAATKPDLVLCDYQMPGVNGKPRACGETMVPSETIRPALARCA